MRLRWITVSLCLGILMSLAGCQPADTDSAPVGTTIEAATATPAASTATTAAETAATSESTAAAPEEADLSGDAHKQQAAEEDGGDSEVVEDYQVELEEDETVEFK